MKKILKIVLASFMVCTTYAQTFDFSGELRPRYENRHGFQNLIAEDEDGSNFVSQRTRLNFGFINDKMHFKVTLQNIRVWGDVGTLSSDDKEQHYMKLGQNIF